MFRYGLYIELDDKRTIFSFVLNLGQANFSSAIQSLYSQPASDGSRHRVLREERGLCRREPTCRRGGKAAHGTSERRTCLISYARRGNVWK
jgi:hypothetical protein